MQNNLNQNLNQRLRKHKASLNEANSEKRQIPVFLSEKIRLDCNRIQKNKILSKAEIEICSRASNPIISNGGSRKIIDKNGISKTLYYTKKNGKLERISKEKYLLLK